MDVLQAIRERRSIRRFRKKPVEREKLLKILEAGRWAPSGLNNQPWKFALIRSDLKNEISKLTEYGDIIRAADCLIAVFLDRRRMYDRTKDLIAVGACIQNMLLAAHSLSLGAVLIGEILKNKVAVRRLLGLPKEMELMGIIAVGYPAERGSSTRIGLNKLLIAEL